MPSKYDYAPLLGGTSSVFTYISRVRAKISLIEVLEGFPETPQDMPWADSIELVARGGFSLRSKHSVSWS